MTSTDTKIHPRSLNLKLPLLALASLGALTLSACQVGNSGEDFISDDPVSGDYGDPAGEGGDGDLGGDDEGNGGGELAVTEADILQIEGDRLYALSEYSGLTVVNMSNPDDLEALGTWETDARPFEMYVEAGQAFVMFNDFGFWHFDEDLGDWSYDSSSRLVALDASNPANIQVEGEFTLPGTIQDSRRVGDVLYLVTMEDGWCWGCDGTQKTVVTSIDISDEANPVLVDQLEFEADNDNWDWQRSVASTSERMYVASRTWEWEGLGSAIDVIDISAGDGSLVKGAQVNVTGRIDSRWQMDEYQGVLRVISQHGWTDDPRIETFTIESAQSLVALGEGSLDIPAPESLRSARFDGDRAYAITAEQTDPLFTIDLSDPANPVQKGALEIPGWVFHMEPRGDRILALGFDQAHPDGSLNVSLFDVADLDNPTLRQRVHFGGDWASFAEDQNRIHKAFTILEDEQMILVPHSGWDYDEGFYECAGSYRSGVQIIDWADDDLILRGLVPTHGQPRRAFTHRDRLFTLSDTELASFDYSDRDAPAASDELAVAVNVDSLVHTGEVWVRMSRDWWTSEQLIEIVDGNDPGSPDPIGRIDIAANADPCSWSWVEKLYAVGDHVFAIRSVESWGLNDYEMRVEVIAVDVSNPADPQIVDTFELDGGRSWGTSYLGNVSLASSWVAQQGQHLALLTTDKNYEQNSVQVLDLSDPANISLVATLERPAGQTQGELSIMSDRIVSWHTEPVPNQQGKVRFYFDRLDLSGEPSWDEKINVPGVIVSYDAEAGRAFTVDFKLTQLQTSSQACFENPKFWNFDWQMGDNGTCTLIDQLVREVEIEGSGASLVRTLDIEGELRLEQLMATPSRLFAKTGSFNSYWGEGIVDEGEGGGGGGGNVEQDPSKLIVIDIEASEPAVRELDGVQFGSWFGIITVDSERAIINGGYGTMSLVDAGDIDDIDVLASELPAWGGCYNPVVDGDTVYCPMGAYGLETVTW